MAQGAVLNRALRYAIPSTFRRADAHIGPIDSLLQKGGDVGIAPYASGLCI